MFVRVKIGSFKFYSFKYCLVLFLFIVYRILFVLFLIIIILLSPSSRLCLNPKPKFKTLVGPFLQAKPISFLPCAYRSHCVAPACLAPHQLHFITSPMHHRNHVPSPSSNAHHYALCQTATTSIPLQQPLLI